MKPSASALKTQTNGGSDTNHSLFPEIDAHGGDKFGVELVVGVAVEEGGLAHSGVSQSQEFDQIVVISIGHSAAGAEPAEQTMRGY